MEVTQKTIEGLHKTFRRRAESSIVEELARENKLSAEDALRTYYTSEVCKASNDDMQEILYLAPQVLIKMLNRC